MLYIREGGIENFKTCNHISFHGERMDGEPLVKINHTCTIHYAKEEPNPPLGTQLVMTSETLQASAIVPANVALALAKDLAEEIFDESNNPCLTYDCQNSKCKRWINILNELSAKYKDLQNKEADYEVELESDDFNDLISWALDYTKDHGLIDDYAEIASYFLAEIDNQVLEELIRAGYSPYEIYEAFRGHIDEDDLLFQLCYLKDYDEVGEFLKEMGYECEDF